MFPLCLFTGVSADREHSPTRHGHIFVVFLLQHYTVAWTHLQEKLTIKTHSHVSQVTGTVYYHVDCTARPRQHWSGCSLYVRGLILPGQQVFVYIMNLLISAHIQLVHIWILYVRFLSLCSHRPIDIFLIWEIVVDGFFLFGKFAIKKENIYRPSIPKTRWEILYLTPLPVLSFVVLPSFRAIRCINNSVSIISFLYLSTSRFLFLTAGEATSAWCYRVKRRQASRESSYHGVNTPDLYNPPQ